MKIVLETEDYQLNPENLQKRFDLLKQEKDILLINEKHKEIDVFIKIKKDSKVKISYFLEEIIVSEEKVEETLLNLLTKLLNFKIILLKGIVVKKMEGEKIRPTIKIYCKNMPYLQIEDELFFDKNNIKSKNEFKECFTFVNQTFICEDEILHSLLKTNILAFKNRNTFRICSLNSSFMIYKTNTNKSIYESIFNISPLKDFYAYILKNKSVSPLITDLCEIFFNDFDPILDEAFYNALITFENKGMDCEEEFLRELVKMAPCFFNKGLCADYFSKIVEVFNSKGYKKRRKSQEYKIGYKTNEQEYLERCYGGSLKYYLSK